MGIRVRKRIGYGLRDLKTRPRAMGNLHVPNDPRWDYMKYMPVEGEDPTPDCTLAGFIDWCEANKERLEVIAVGEGLSPHSHFLFVSGLRDRLRRKDSYHTTPCSALEWDSEFGLKRVLLFTPIEHAHDWIRSDDIMDYYEEQGRGLRRRATPIKGYSGIYPYDGTMRRFRLPTREVSSKLSGATGTLSMFSRLHGVRHGRDVSRLLDGAEVTSMGGESYNGIIGAWRESLHGPDLADPDVVKHFREDWRPLVPLGVLAIVEYLGCFPDAYGQDGVVNSLRPMIYVHWS